MNKELEKKFDEVEIPHQITNKLTYEEYGELDEIIKFFVDTHFVAKEEWRPDALSPDGTQSEPIYTRPQVLDIIGEDRPSGFLWDEISDGAKSMLASYGYNQAKAEQRAKLK